MGVSLLDRIFRRSRPPVTVEDGGAVMAEVMAPAAPGRVALWNASRVGQAEALWGEGFLWPGGADEIRRLTAPFGLTAAHSLLLVGAGTGGPARLLAADLGAWVSGFEADSDLVALANVRLQRGVTPLSKRATMALWLPDAPAFTARGFHHALAIDAFGGPDPEGALAAIAGAVKPGGQVMIVQSVAGGAGGAEARRIAVGLKRAGCDVRVVEDETARHASQVLQGWKQLVRSLRGSRLTPVEAAALVAEAERWLLRLHRIREGRLHLLRWGAIAG